jgi:pilus assembly protein Flp/PilA
MQKLRPDATLVTGNGLPMALQIDLQFPLKLYGRTPIYPLSSNHQKRPQTLTGILDPFELSGDIMFQALITSTARLLHDDSGQDLIEYALLAALLGLGAVLAMNGLSTKVSTAFSTVGTQLTSNV